MVNRDRVAAKVSELSDRVSRVKQHCPASPTDLAANRDALDLVSFNLMLAVQACADVASHMIADEGWPAAQTLAEGFQRLHEKSVISAETAAALSRAVALRNIVAHGYAGIDAKIVHAAAMRGIADLDTFAREIVNWLSSRPVA
jgi:uncharacterized protein YutE (UPF0331/DUF86 family)